MASSLQTVVSDRPAFGYPALFDELRSQGIDQASVIAEAGMDAMPERFGVQHHLALMRAAQRLARDPLTALAAGQRQQIANYGAYGYALATCATLRDALRIGNRNFAMTGAVLRVTIEIMDGQGVWRSHRPESLGAALPFVAEYWRSSQQQFFSQILGRRFPSLHMVFPYRAPAHGEEYRQVFGCPIEFGSDVMEWRFDASVLDEPCAHADPVTAQLCEDYCEQFVRDSGGGSPFRREVLRTCVALLATSSADAPAVAHRMNLSLRTFYRRLADEGLRFQDLLDRLLLSIAREYLQNTELSVETIAERCGYRDPSNFRKAFKRWTGQTPSAMRRSDRREDGPGRGALDEERAP